MMTRPARRICSVIVLGTCVLRRHRLCQGGLAAVTLAPAEAVPEAKPPPLTAAAVQAAPAQARRSNPIVCRVSVG
jgi:hypothetical protein